MMRDGAVKAGHTLSAKEKNSWVFAGFGQNMVITFVTTFMLIYLYEGVGFSAAGVALLTAIISAAKVWDALSDLIMGVFVDRTRTRWGKLRPWILFTALPVALLTVLLFRVPAFSEAGRIAYFSAVYILWGMVYTMCDVPYWGLSGVLTSDGRERTDLISYARTLGTLALGITTLLGPQLAKWLGGGDRATALGWTRTAGLVALLGMGLFTLAFFNTRERVPLSSEKLTIGRMFRTVLGNRPLLLVLLGSVLGFGRSIIQVGGAVVALIVFGDEGTFTLLGAALIAALVLSTLATPLVLRRISKKALMTGSGILGSIVYLLMYFLGYGELGLVVFLIFLSGIFTGFFIVVQTAMIADSVDWLEYKSGQRNEGICFAGLTFVSKVMGALATMAFGLVVAAIGYAKGVPVTAGIRNGVWFAITIIPALSSLAGVIPFFFYPLSEGRMREIMVEILARRTHREPKSGA